MSEKSENQVPIIAKLKEEAEQNEARRASERVKPSNPFMNPASLNIFAKEKNLPTVELFSSKQDTVNLFSMFKNRQVQGAQNIFNIKTNPVIQSKEENESSASKSGRGSFKVEPQQKQMKYEYGMETNKLGMFQLRKFKNGQCAPKQEVYLTIESPPKNKQYLYITIRNRGTKLPIYKGVYIRDSSKMDHFMGKDDILRIQIISKQEKQKKDMIQEQIKQNSEIHEERTEEKTTNLIKEIIKMQFMTKEDCTECQNILKGEKN